MLPEENISYNQYINYYLPHCVGPGSLPNYLVSTCQICRDNGYPHEAVVVQTLLGNTIKLVNYSDGSEHVHKQVLDDREVWSALWSEVN